MSTNVEIESKSMLTKDEYEKLLSNFDTAKIYKQINYYIDSKDLILSTKKYGLRVRIKNDEFELTLKVPLEEGKLEINQQISNNSFENLKNNNDFPNGEIKKFLEQKLNIDSTLLFILGNLTTYRLDLPFKSSLISIDKSKYNSVIDYEIECEDASLKIAKQNLKDFLSRFDIEYKKSPASKLKRFLKTL